MTVGYEGWDCSDCGANTEEEYYTVHDSIWETYATDIENLLCVGCLEARMGRELRASDFPHYLINVINYGVKSDRLAERLLRV